jgi:hypothetical protein
MSEAVAERAFKKYKNTYIKQMGNKATTSTQLSHKGKLLFGKRYLGTFPQNMAPLGKSGYAILNTDISGGPGIHWCALYLTPKSIYVYDSYARPSTKLLKILSKNANAKKIKIHDSDRNDAEQFGVNTEICGPLSMAWLSCVRQLGIRSSMKI